jgi:hypothetical protein
MLSCGIIRSQENNLNKKCSNVISNFTNIVLHISCTKICFKYERNVFIKHNPTLDMFYHSFVLVENEWFYHILLIIVK